MGVIIAVKVRPKGAVVVIQGKLPALRRHVQPRLAPGTPPASRLPSLSAKIFRLVSGVARLTCAGLAAAPMIFTRE
jgi:hypothetical protein